MAELETGPERMTDRPDAASLAAEVEQAYSTYLPYRRPHERVWFTTAAFLRGQQFVEWNDVLGKLVVPEAASYQVRAAFNKIRPKHRARMGKFFKNRPRPMVIAASTDYQDLMDARATEKALLYQWDRLSLETKYRDARQWASICGKSFWWFGYDPSVKGRVKINDPFTGDERDELTELGDVTIEVSSAWEVLVKDPTLSRIGQQPEILRVRSLSTSEAQRRYPEFAERLKQGRESTEPSDTRREQLSALSAQGNAGTPRKGDAVLLKERFIAPCAKYPKGAKMTTCDGVLVRYEEELPFEFWDSPTNPFPCTEFTDTDTPGQFFGTTFLEQLIDLQRVYNDVLCKIHENIRAVSRPKVVVYKQHNLADGAWTNAAGEVVELTYVPNLPPPQIIQAANVAGDCWNLISYLDREFDAISQIYPSSEGRTAGAESGYQTSLLQEATDAVHGPDIRNDELSIQDAAWKIRRIMKLTYDIPRLIAIGGDNAAPEMLEFSQRQINDAAEVRIQIGSMLPDLKTAKAQVLLNFYEKGLLGDQNDPLVKRRALSLMEMGGYEVLNEEERLDETEAAREDAATRDGGAYAPAKFYQHHQIHAAKHEATMKKPEWERYTPDAKLTHIAHLISHYDFLNPDFANGLRAQYNLLSLPIATPPPLPAPNSVGSPSVGAPAAPTPAAAAFPPPPPTAPAPPTVQ